MIKILSVCGSPVRGSSTEIILDRIARAIAANLGEKSRRKMLRLNELDFAACQACGEDPSPAYCFLDDGLNEVYRDLISADYFLFGSPIYFDAVSAQAKMFIDRCNCLKPPVFGQSDPATRFVKRLPDRRRPGAIVLVGSERAWFEGARRCVAGLFKWLEVDNHGLLKFETTDVNRHGEAADTPNILEEADQLGRTLVASTKA